jgi:methyltransferase (TIGR00027 family)
MTGASVSQTGVASSTAMMSACGRGWHLMKHGPSAALADWLAWPLVGPAAEPMAAQLFATLGEQDGEYAAAWTAVRAAITETWLAESEATHYVILGSGLDSYAWRQKTPGHTVIEIDHPATQEWKRERMSKLFLDEPAGHVWAPCDFERESIGDVMGRIDVGSEPPFISWIGVTPYLSEEAVATTLRALPPCTVAVGYCLPVESWAGKGVAMSTTFLQMAEHSGEKITTFYAPESFADVLADAGFALLDDVGPEVSKERYGHEAWSLGYERLALARKP